MTVDQAAFRQPLPEPQPYPVHFEASASDATTGNNGVAFVEYKVNSRGPTSSSWGP